MWNGREKLLRRVKERVLQDTYTSRSLFDARRVIFERAKTTAPEYPAAREPRDPEVGPAGLFRGLRSRLFGTADGKKFPLSGPRSARRESDR